MHSMTAFARVRSHLNQMEWTFEIKSVNHRFLDLSFRLPEYLRFIEPNCRSILSKNLSRGRVEIHLQVQSSHQQAEICINHAALEQLLQMSEQISTQYGLANDLSLSQCLNFPGIFKSKETMSDESYEEIALTLFNQAIAQLLVSRAQEGQAIAGILLDKAQQLKVHVQAIHSELNDIKSFYQMRLQDKIKQVTDVAVDASRLEQELAVLLLRQDISEELDRLTTHLDALLEQIEARGPLGRRLDFLVQELHRETNTIASKTDVKSISQICIDMKVLIEQLREQIQNVE